MGYHRTNRDYNFIDHFYFRTNVCLKMSKGFVVSEQKLAEKLVVLKERGNGMLTRIYNIKKGYFINYYFFLQIDK